jgi:hypothetical protein
LVARVVGGCDEVRKGVVEGVEDVVVLRVRDGTRASAVVGVVGLSGGELEEEGE